jgi:hypothetical protein
LPSNFLLVEQASAQRDAKTWAAAVHAGLAGAPVVIEQVTGDAARGLCAPEFVPAATSSLELKPQSASGAITG